MPAIDFLDRFVEDAQAKPPPTPETPPEPSYIHGNQRRLKQVDAPVIQRREWQDLEQFRETVARVMREYMMQSEPEEMLLIPAPPGSGKTWAGVDFAHWVYAQTKHRVLYAGPRTNFYEDVINTATRQGQNTNLWYDWKPRRKDDQDPDKHTCNHAENINNWLAMGYEGMDFCSRVCGWDYINDGCPYHAQKNRTEPLIYGNHLHVTLGHPLAKDFAVVIGDELPLGALAWEWTLPASRVQFADIPLEYDLSPILFDLNRLCGADLSKPVSGPELLGWLGGPAKVLESVDDVMADGFVMANVIAPQIPRDGNLDRVPANYLPIFLPILKREAAAALAEQEYPHRLFVDGRGLTILTRRAVNDQMPDHVIWFDATGTQELYEAMFNRPVRTLNTMPKMAGRIYQVTDRNNGKSSLLQHGKDEPTETSKAPQMRSQIDRICQDFQTPAVITYQHLEESIQQSTAHFYGSRGTNQFETCDVLVVAGTPMPPLYQIEKMAKCLWPERMRAFDKTWFTVDRRYNFTGPDGEGYAYPVSQFGDPELNVLLWQYRDGEIVQAAHRARILFRDVSVYLLTNLPIDDLPPTQLLTIRELLGAPEGVDVVGRRMIVAFAETLGAVGTKDLVENFGIDPRTARKYIGFIAEMPGWEIMAVRTGPGRPQCAAHRSR